MRHILSAIAAIVLAAPAQARDSTSIPSSALSRCAGKVGTDTRRSDPAFGAIMLDGMPWTTIERTEEKSGAHTIATTVIGSGALRRRDGTLVTFRFTCGLDTKGQPLMFHASQLLPSRSEASVPATVVAGSARYGRKMALPHGAELRIQLLDDAAQPPAVGGPAEPVILAEQVVRSGWEVPIPFALHLPEHTPLEGHRILVTARLVVQHQSLFQLMEPHVVTAEDLHKSLELMLDPVQAPNR
jgi:uncharacterized lipoprotein YbaY